MKDEMLKSHCQACESGVGVLASAALHEAMRKLPDWKLDEEEKSMSRHLSSKISTNHGVCECGGVDREPRGSSSGSGSGLQPLQSDLQHAFRRGITNNDLVCAAAIDQLSGE